jgi:hypothetical protein
VENAACDNKQAPNLCAIRLFSFFVANLFCETKSIASFLMELQSASSNEERNSMLGKNSELITTSEESIIRRSVQPPSKSQFDKAFALSDLGKQVPLDMHIRIIGPAL